MIYTFLPIKDIPEIVFNLKMMRFSKICKIFIVMVFMSLAKYHASLDPKNRDITLPIKFHIIKAMIFPVVMYECESWTMRKAGCWKTDAFELWCWRRLLRVPWTVRTSNKSILKEISLEYSWKDWSLCWNSNTLATWFKELTHWKRPWCWERLKAWGAGGNRGWDSWMSSPTQWTWVWASSRRSWRTRKPGMLQSMGLQKVRHDWMTEQKQQIHFYPK